MTNPSFDKDYVISLTLRHMKSNIELSIAKTIGRVAEFEGNGEKSMEIMQTLSALHSMKRNIEEINSTIVDTKRNNNVSS